jgi:flagellar M-ring protein FliF
VKAAPGKVSRLSVAVLLDDKVKVPPAEITNLVNAAAGIDGKRGDVVSVQAMAFDHSATEAAAKEQKAAAAAKTKAQMMNFARTGGVLLIVLVALFLAWRSAKKAGVTRYPVPGVLSAGPVQAEALHAALSALSSPSASPSQSIEPSDRFERPALPTPVANDVNDELAELIERQPEEVASILRGWLADRRG